MKLDSFDYLQEPCFVCFWMVRKKITAPAGRRRKDIQIHCMLTAEKTFSKIFFWYCVEKLSQILLPCIKIAPDHWAVK